MEKIGHIVAKVYIKVKGEGKWLYRAVDKHGDTLDFLLTTKGDATAAKRFFHKTLHARNSSTPRVINADKHKVYPPAFTTLQQDKTLPKSTELRQNKYPNKERALPQEKLLVTPAPPLLPQPYPTASA